MPIKDLRLTSLAPGGGCGCKIAPNVLQDILGEVSMPLHRDLMVNAANSDDAAVYRISGEVALIATTDFFMPIVDDPRDFGRIAAANALSDIYAMGGQPIFSLAIVGMPVGKLPPKIIREILAGGREIAEAAGAPVAGGHSIDSAEPIYGLVAVGLTHPDKVLRNDTALEGDVLILGKPLGIGIFSAALKKDALSPADYAQMVASTTLLNNPGAALGNIDGVHAVTDVTGFGLLGHLSEMCRGSGLGATIDQSAVPVFENSRTLLRAGFKTGASGRNWQSICSMVEDAEACAQEARDLFCDPQTSGGLLVACSPEAVEAVLQAFHQHGHECAAVIGQLTSRATRIHMT